MAGGDLDEMQGFQNMTAQERKDWLFRHVHNVVRNMHRLDKPTIAAINGDAMGVGATLALCCDMQVIANTARIADTHVKVGLVAGDGGAVIWPQCVRAGRRSPHTVADARWLSNLIRPSDPRRN